MIFQDINFLKALPKPPKVYPAFYHVLLLWAAVGLGLMVSYGYKKHDITSIEAKIVVEAKNEKTMLKELSALGEEQSKDSASQSGELVAIVKRRFVDQQEGFYPAFLNLSQKVHHKLWLNHIVIDRSQNAVRFSGNALEAGAIYHFIDQLKTLPSFQGRYFNLLALEEVDFNLDAKDKKTKQPAFAEAKSVVSAGKKEQANVQNVIKVLSFVLQTNAAVKNKRRRGGR